MVLESTQPPIQWVPAALSLRIKRPGCEADHSPPLSTEVKKCVALYLHSPSKLSWYGAQLKKKTGTTVPSPLASKLAYALWTSPLISPEIHVTLPPNTVLDQCDKQSFI